MESAATIVARVVDGEASALEFVERALERLNRWQPHTNAFTEVLAEEAEEAAPGLRRANEILKSAAAFFGAELDRRPAR